MAQHRIEEVFRAIAPSRRRGIPNPPTITAGVSGNGADSGNSLSQAGVEIAQLRASYQQQADLIKANTQAVQNNTSAQGSRSTGSSIGSALTGVFGGALGLLSPVISGISHLFGSGSSQPVALPVYTPPPPVSIGGILHSNVQPGEGSGTASQAQPTGSGTSAGPAAQNSHSTTYAPQITVNVSAMDSQSFMDRSGDIANAVREAMLNNHPINGVVADL